MPRYKNAEVSMFCCTYEKAYLIKDILDLIVETILDTEKAIKRKLHAFKSFYQCLVEVQVVYKNTLYNSTILTKSIIWKDNQALLVKKSVFIAIDKLLNKTKYEMLLLTVECN